MLTTVENKILDTSNLVKKIDYNTKITGVENNIKKLQAYDLSYIEANNILMKEMVSKII